MDPGREREERIQASLKEREREVKMSRSAQEKEWGRERDQLRKTEAVQHFKALLVDMVSRGGGRGERRRVEEVMRVRDERVRRRRMTYGERGGEVVRDSGKRGVVSRVREDREEKEGEECE